ncbi:MAG: DUF3710 domain-containing protein [Dermatophilus congolensis]|nr:DUF3710 domain-containing protein [Dermatophilus congolensis]
MALFRRKRSTDDETQVSDVGAATAAAEPGTDGISVAEAAEAAEVQQSSEPVLGDHRAEDLGPFDSGAVPRPEGFLDLGSLWLPNIPGVTLMVEADPNTDEVTALRVQIAASVLQLQVFAAPKSERLWGEIRAEIAESLKAGGGSGVEQTGPYGDELVATVPAGAGATATMRFLGVDGPRWFLRGVISGPAATDESLAKPFIDLLRVVVVHRGDGPMAPRELLPMHMPKNIEAAAPQAAQGIDYEAELSPFERGPEITEIR